MICQQLKKIGRKYKEQSEATQKELDQLKATSAGQQTQQSTAAAAAEQANRQLTDRLAAVEREREEIKAKVTQKETEVTSLKEQVQKIQQVGFFRKVISFLSFFFFLFFFCVHCFI